MKKIHILLVTALIGLSSCELAKDIDDYKPQNKLTESNVLVDANSAESCLAGIYSNVRTQFIAESWETIPSLYGLSATHAPSRQGGAEAQFANNEVKVDNMLLNNFYLRLYSSINSCNFFIEDLPAANLPDLSETRKKEMLGEARFVRALMHFGVLRLWGQFYDINSELGIVVNTLPARDNKTYSRNTVKEAYDLILADLDFAAKNCPQKECYYASTYAAKALKARVLLYMKNYAGAAALAKDVIENGPYVLETSFEDVFTNGIASNELIYSIYYNPTEYSSAGDLYRFNIKPSSYLSNLSTAEGDLRYPSVIMKPSPYKNGKYPNPIYELGGNPIYFLRLAELYLIYAEAEARRDGGNIALASELMNKIRTRSGLSPKKTTGKSELLEAIRVEKVLELATENGEEWFDLVRYTVEGNIADIKTIKPTLTSKDLYILPFPSNALNGNKGKLKQNPGYPG